MSSVEVIALALALAAALLVIVELVREQRELIAWAVLLLAIVEILTRL